jgi:nucleoside-diphosphate-sugar epimerase
MPTAFVTGGSGFIGGALIERLRREGWEVRALARSERAAERARELGAEPVMGDLDDLHVEGCEIAFHAAAKVEDFGDPADFERVNVQGTRNVVAACRAGGVRRLVHVGTEAALMAGQPLVNVDESAPLRPDSPALYPSTKAKAERLVRDANGDGLETVVVRPRFVWGRGDATLLPRIVEMVRSGRFRWVGGGRQLTATTHIDNTVEGL